MADLEQRLATHNLIGLDTSIFIYHLEGQATYLPLTREILGRVEVGHCGAVVSTVTIMELTVHPWRVHRADVARQYEVLLVNFPHLEIVDVTRDVARKAAQLRAHYNLRPADALQVGTAIVGGATLWVSNDKQLERLVPEIEILILDEYVGVESN